jgi:hypothetical protein
MDMLAHRVSRRLLDRGDDLIALGPQIGFKR